MSIEEEFPSSMEEYGVQDAIHGMCHQKVRAEDQWGFIPLTQDRVKRLIDVVEENENNYMKHNCIWKFLIAGQTMTFLEQIKIIMLYGNCN